MRVKVLFFAQLRELFEETERLVDAEEGISAGVLAVRLLQGPHAHSLPLLYAVNENFVSADEKLKDKDVLALMTPVSGG
jgi:molybdopterin synthase sulfur carrier subunit